MLKEWPLVVFTLLGQTAVGVFWLFHLPFLARFRAPTYGWRVTWLVVLAAVLLIAGAAALVSFFHLRHPWRARFVLSNWRTSWLSREILSELVFMALVAASGWIAWVRAPSRGPIWGLLVAAALAGAFFLVSMARIYMLPTLPAWRGAWTPLSFVLCALVLGALTTEVLVRTVAGPGVFGLDFARGAMALVAIDILLAVLAAPRHGLFGDRPAPSLRPVTGPPLALHLARIGFLVVGLGLIGIDVASGANDIMNEKGAGPFLLLALGAVAIGEAAGRFHFYGLVERPGDRGDTIRTRPGC